MSWRKFLFIFIPAIFILIIPFFFIENQSSNDQPSHNNNQPQNNKDKDKNKESSSENGQNNSKDKEQSDSKEIYWGVDSASFTTNELFSCVRDNFGKPKVWGRYLGTIDGVSSGLTKDEIKLLQDNNIKILLINNQFTDASGYDNGVEQAKKGIKIAEDLGAPDGVAIFADIEPEYPVDSAFIQGWFDEMSNSKYEPGIYGVFSNEQALLDAFNAAVEENSQLLKDVILWTAFPQEGITTKGKAPKFNPEGPKDSLLYGWQYGIDAETCNIDTNLFNGRLLDYLW
ncbi:DUF1906 domain-containing protein [Bacillus sp. 31A1R]|uniref:DUF1906 domain-containing protein n=1 Tax=Robertmurraya mangrovi TaxID=3098077 RepID=A0ABU5J506_9BACI|nr:glycoside hydrolase domain-containing protein [Bacillus sp. 31A1R]MDZ5474501.1 DUF1906 domain-containing protein [Bacillus sp. 31A1R]